MSEAHPRPRPWYVLDDLVDTYLDIAVNGGDLKMLQALKVIRGITLNFAVVAMTWFAIAQGADPTLIGTIGLVALLVINGIEISDWIAAKQALDEAKQQTTEE